MFVLNDRIVDETAAAARYDARYRDGPAHRYALHLADTAEMLGQILYLRKIGAGVFPIHPDMPPATARTMAVRAGCDRFVSDAGITPLEPTAAGVFPIHPDMPPETARTMAARAGSDRLVSDAGTTPREPTAAGGGVLVHMSSGTTGAPKVIARPWPEIALEIESYARAFPEPGGMTPVIACPITHSYGLIPGVMVARHRGQSPVVIDSLNPKYILRRLREVERPLLYTSPAMLHTLACLLPAGERLHAAMTSGTTLPSPWFARIRERTLHLFQQYGCSETGCIAINPDLRAAEEIGYPLPHLTVRAGAGAPAPIVVTAPGGTIDTGDLGCIDPRGMLVFVSRGDDMINVAGLNVYPQDVEQVALAMPGVEDALVFRIEDPLAGARVGLLFKSAGRDADELRAWCRQRLAGYQLPTVLFPVAEIPRQANGKVNRRDVAARYARGALIAEATP